MPHSRSVRRDDHGLRQRTDWTGLFLAAPVNVPANSKVLLMTFAPGTAAFDHVTVRRVRGFMNISPDTNVAEEQIGALGLGVFEDTAVAIGIASLPDPVTDVSDDIWLAHWSFAYRTSIGPVGAIRGKENTTMVLDSKGMRKIPIGKTLCAIIANTHAADAFDIMLNLRILFGAGLKR